MLEKYIFIDCDGVILDSEQRMLERKEKAGFLNHTSSSEFTNYFSLADTIDGEWEYIIKNAKSINNSVEIIRELENMKTKIAILTKIHSLKEMKIKVEDLRENRHISAPIFFVPQGIKKHQMIIPDGQLLIDDSKSNIDGWIKFGGAGLLFDEKIDKNSKVKVKSLEFLLKLGENGNEKY